MQFPFAVAGNPKLDDLSSLREFQVSRPLKKQTELWLFYFNNWVLGSRSDPGPSWAIISLI